jgi:hypothetical protein
MAWKVCTRAGPTAERCFGPERAEEIKMRVLGAMLTLAVTIHGFLLRWRKHALAHAGVMGAITRVE